MKIDYVLSFSGFCQFSPQKVYYLNRSKYWEIFHFHDWWFFSADCTINFHQGFVLRLKIFKKHPRIKDNLTKLHLLSVLPKKVQGSYVDYFIFISLLKTYIPKPDLILMVISIHNYLSPIRNRFSGFGEAMAISLISDILQSCFT